jgi:hypothetical protein
MNKEPIIGRPEDQHKMGGHFIDLTWGKRNGEGSCQTVILTFDELMKYFGKMNESIDVAAKKQSQIEEKIADFAFEQTPQGRGKFVMMLHMFFSPSMIPDGLTIGQARLLYIISLHYKTRFGGETLPQTWLHNPNEPMNDIKFSQGLEEFMEETIGTNGFWFKENELALSIVHYGISEVTPENTVKVGEFIGV